DNEPGILEPAAIEKVCAEAWPTALNPDELHDALMLAGVLTDAELLRVTPEAPAWLNQLASQNRAARFTLSGRPGSQLWYAAERLPMLSAIYPRELAMP